MASTLDKAGRPLVVVTGMGVVTSLGAGKQENWQKLTAGVSGIRTIRRFPTEGLKTTIAGSIDFVPFEPFCSTELGERLAVMAIEEAIGEAGIGTTFPGPLFLAVAPEAQAVESEMGEPLVPKRTLKFSATEPNMQRSCTARNAPPDAARSSP